MIIVAWGGITIPRHDVDPFFDSLAKYLVKGSLQVDPENRCKLVFTPDAMIQTSSGGEWPPNAQYVFNTELQALMALELFKEHLRKARV